MRHGQTVFNLKGKIQGASDSPLTALGVQQANAAQQYFKTKNIHFDYLYSSPQQRACDTLENAVPNQRYWCVKDLKEWGFGLFEGDLLNNLDICMVTLLYHLVENQDLKLNTGFIEHSMK